MTVLSFSRLAGRSRLECDIRVPVIDEQSMAKGYSETSVLAVGLPQNTGHWVTRAPGHQEAFRSEIYTTASEQACRSRLHLSAWDEPTFP
jgi:hypothetical protein